MKPHSAHLAAFLLAAPLAIAGCQTPAPKTATAATDRVATVAASASPVASTASAV